MKCCHLTSVHSAFDSRIFYKECLSLAKAGFDVSLIAPADKSEERDGIKIIPMKKSSSRIPRMLITANEVYKQAIKLDASLYHFHDPELIRIGLKLKQLGKKVIYDVHEDVPRQLLSKHYLPGFTRRFISSSFEDYENKAVKKFDAIVTVTPKLEKRFAALNPNTIMVRNFPSLEEFSGVETNWSARKNEVCYAGSITKIRGINEMISAAEKAKVKLHLAGAFSPAPLRRDVARLRGWTNVEEHGYLSRDEIRTLFSSCKIGLSLLHPTESYMDAYPIKMFEYMAAGMPVIASNFPLWKDIVENYRCGICIDPFNTDAIANAIKYLLYHDEEAREMGINGRQAVQEKFNWQQEEKKLIDLYQRMAGNKQ